MFTSLYKRKLFPYTTKNIIIDKKINIKLSLETYYISSSSLLYSSSHLHPFKLNNLVTQQLWFLQS